MMRRDVLRGGAALLACPAAAGAAAPREPPIAAIADYERASGGRIALFARNVRTGATLAWRADARVVMCSTFKASLAALVLSRVDRGQESLDAPVAYGPADIQDWWAPVAKANVAKGALPVREMCRAAVEESDNTCADRLLARVGGPPAVTAFWRRLGDPVSRLDDDEPILNRTPPGGVRDTTTPAAMAGTLRRLVLGPALAAPSRATFTAWLVGCKTGDNRLRAGLPAAWVIGDKTGNNGADAAGDIAVAWPRPDTPIVICAYTRGGAPTPQQLDAVFAGVGRAVAARLAPGA